MFINFGMKTTFALPGRYSRYAGFSWPCTKNFRSVACQSKSNLYQSKLKFTGFHQRQRAYQRLRRFLIWNISGSSVSIAMGGTEN
jgi:hypothetical protein